MVLSTVDYNIAKLFDDAFNREMISVVSFRGRVVCDMCTSDTFL